MMNSPLLSPRGRGNLSNFLKAVVPTWLSCSRGGWMGGVGGFGGGEGYKRSEK